MTDRDLAQRDGIHPDISERYENSLERGRVSAAEASAGQSPELGEREAIATWLEARAHEYQDFYEQGQGRSQRQMRARWKQKAQTLEEAAREIRDGLHRQGKHANGAGHEE